MHSIQFKNAHSTNEKISINHIVSYLAWLADLFQSDRVGYSVCMCESSHSWTECSTFIDTFIERKKKSNNQLTLMYFIKVGNNNLRFPPK